MHVLLAASSHSTTTQEAERRPALPAVSFNPSPFIILWCVRRCTSQSSDRTQYYDVISSVRRVCVYRQLERARLETHSGKQFAAMCFSASLSHMRGCVIVIYWTSAELKAVNFKPRTAFAK